MDWVQVIGWILLLGPIIGTVIVLSLNVPPPLPSDTAELEVWKVHDALVRAQTEGVNAAGN